MREAPLYAEPPLAVIERTTSRDVDFSCSRCVLHRLAASVCMPARGEPGGVLCVGDYPGVEEDKEGMPFVGSSGRYLRRELARSWNGPVAFDNALRCMPGGEESVEEEQVAACRSFLAQTLREARPTRILALGGRAVQSLFGRHPPMMSVRRGYGWLYNQDIDDTGQAIPVFFLNNPAFALRNRFAKAWFEEDLRRALSIDPALPPWDAKIRIVETYDDSLRACAELRRAPWFAFDIETVGILFEPDFRVISLAACPAGNDDSFLWPEQELHSNVVEPLRALLSDPAVGKVGHNLKFDAHGTRCDLRAIVNNHHGDTCIWFHLLAADAVAKLEVVSELVGMGGAKEEARIHLTQAIKTIQKERKRCNKALPLFGLDPVIDAACRRPTEKPKRYAYGLIPKPELHRYNARDAVATARIGVRMERAIDQSPDLKSLWDSVLCGVSEAVEQVEAWGVAASRENAEIFRAHLEAKMSVLNKRFKVYPNLDPNSPSSVGALLFGELGLCPPKYTDKGATSTDKESLTALKGEHPIVDDLIEHRRLTKLHGTYAVGVPAYIRSDGRIHPSIKPDGAETGRTSCEEPNLQNLPRPTSSEGKMSRDIFVAPPGKLLVELDYSQLELRVATMLSQDPDMMAIWKEGVDYHRRTAELIAQVAWGVRPDQITEEHRTIAKTVNFGVIYGMKAFTLASRLGCSQEEAERVMEAISGKFKILTAWTHRQIDTAKRTGSVRTWWDGRLARGRPLPDIISRDDRRRNHAENAAGNTPIQGTASDFCMASLVVLTRWIFEDCVPAKLVLPVHDSLLFEADEDAVDEVAWQGQRVMTSWPSAGVPLVADVKVGKSWGSLKKYVPGSMSEARCA